MVLLSTAIWTVQLILKPVEPFALSKYLQVQPQNTTQEHKEQDLATSSTAYPYDPHHVRRPRTYNHGVSASLGCQELASNHVTLAVRHQTPDGLTPGTSANGSRNEVVSGDGDCSLGGSNKDLTIVKQQKNGRVDGKLS